MDYAKNTYADLFNAQKENQFHIGNTSPKERIKKLKKLQHAVGLHPKQLQKYTKLLSEVSQRIARAPLIPCILKKPRLEIMKRSFFYKGAILWNKQLEHVQMSLTMECLRKLLNAWYEYGI